MDPAGDGGKLANSKQDFTAQRNNPAHSTQKTKPSTETYD
jgi:hypothetical protein